MIMENWVVVRGSADGFAQEISVGRHRITADEPITAGGKDTGACPYHLLLAALGSCTSMTIGMYARRKQWPLQDVTVRLQHSRIHAADCADCETKQGMLDKIDREIILTGAAFRRAAGPPAGYRQQVSRTSDTHVRNQDCVLPGQMNTKPSADALGYSLTPL